MEIQLSNNRQTKAGKMRSRFDGRGSENNEASRKNFNLDDSDEAEDVTPQRKVSSVLQARTRTVSKGRIYLDPGGSYDSSDSGRHNDDEPSSEDSVGRERDLRYKLKGEEGRLEISKQYERSNEQEGDEFRNYNFEVKGDAARKKNSDCDEESRDRSYYSCSVMHSVPRKVVLSKSIGDSLSARHFLNRPCNDCPTISTIQNKRVIHFSCNQ